MWTGLILCRIGPMISCCEHGYELSDTIESYRILD